MTMVTPAWTHAATLEVRVTASGELACLHAASLDLSNR